MRDLLDDLAKRVSAEWKAQWGVIVLRPLDNKLKE